MPIGMNKMETLGAYRAKDYYEINLWANGK